MNLSEKQSGIVFVIVGPGGAGKNTLMHDVIDNTANLSQLATATTRQPRDNEQQGIHHLFVSLPDFQKMIANGELLEWQEVTTGRFYGIPRQSVDSKINTGEDLIADIEVRGAKVLRETYPEHTILVFVTVPGETEEEVLNELRRRMQNRGDDESVIVERLQRARDLELPFAKDCDYLVINDRAKDAVVEVEGIVLKVREDRKELARRIEG